MTNDRYRETFETWDKVATLYQEKFMNLDLYNATYDFIGNSIASENAKILEIGLARVIFQSISYQKDPTGHPRN